MVRSTTVGIIANPASARDIRRLVAQGGSLTTHDKVNLLHRVLAGLGAVGVDRVLSMADGSGIMSGLLRGVGRPSNASWPELTFVDQPITRTEADTSTATGHMVEAGVGAIVVLGGDGTNRVVAAHAGAVPLVSISTGTNNAFPQASEATVAGVAAGLVATHRDCRTAGTYRAKTLEVVSGDRIERALVDVAITDVDGVGSGAVWDSSTLRELYLSFAEADAIGLSAIGGHLRPVARRHPEGLAIRLGEPARYTVHPPIGPGLLSSTSVHTLSSLVAGRTVEARAASGVVAVDGERLFRFGIDRRPRITLRHDGPVVVDVAATLRFAAEERLLSETAEAAEPAARSSSSSTGDAKQPPNSPDEKGNHCEATQSARALHRDGQDPAVRVPDPAGVPR
ncbi:MAG: NAD(+)/NADH kinase [Actinomycetota bacterium]